MSESVPSHDAAAAPVSQAPGGTVPGPAHRIAVVGIGEDGWDGLTQAAAQEIELADVVVGSERQLSLIAGHVVQMVVWPSPMTQAMRSLHETYPHKRIAVLASGDPMLYGVGASLAAHYGADAIEVYPHVSSASLACARLGWPLADVDVISTVGRPLTSVVIALQPGRRVLVLVSTRDAAAKLAELAVANGLPAAKLTVLERLGGAFESARSLAAADWMGHEHDPFAIVAIDCTTAGDTSADNTAGQGATTARAVPLTSGIPDDLWRSDGALTKREVRAITLATLAPMPGQLLWDVGAGSGSIAIEWMRSHRSCQAIAIESRDDRVAIITGNAERFGVPGLQIVLGRAPESLADLPVPDVIFIGGGLTKAGVVQACLAALPVGGRLVANGVTVETEVALAQWYAQLGGELTRVAVSHAGALGGFTTFRPALPVTQWSYLKESDKT